MVGLVQDMLATGASCFIRCVNDFADEDRTKNLDDSNHDPWCTEHSFQVLVVK